MIPDPIIVFNIVTHSLIYSCLVDFIGATQADEDGNSIFVILGGGSKLETSGDSAGARDAAANSAAAPDPSDVTSQGRRYIADQIVRSKELGYSNEQVQQLTNCQTTK